MLFLHTLTLSRAITLQINIVEKLHDNPLWARTIDSTKNADTILKVFRDISSLCEVFQVSFSNYLLPHGILMLLERSTLS